MIKVLFVCLGNICRSPMAEAVFRQLVNEAGLEHKVQIDSAATSSWEHGNPVHPGTRNELSKVGITNFDNMYSRPLNDNDLTADYIIGMDKSNINNIKRFIGNRPSGEVRMLLEYAGEDREITDPWYTEKFDVTYRDILKGCTALLEKIKNDLQ